MAIKSEAEFERLYQEFVRNGGGMPTLTNSPTLVDTLSDSQSSQSLLGVGFNTPSLYYQETNNAAGLGNPTALSELQAKQVQYNRSIALQTIESEIAANNFTNPYVTRADIGNLTYNDYMTSAGGTAIGSLYTAFNLLDDSTSGGSALVLASVFAGVLEKTGIDFEKLILGALVGAAAIDMFGKLTSHTNNQLSNLPQTLEDVSSLSSMNQTFGQPAGGCDIFNQLMGIMSGAFDGGIDFINSVGSKLTELLNATGLPALISQVAGDITSIINGVVGGLEGAISSIIDQVSSIVNSVMEPFKSLLNEAAQLASNVMGAISSVANQIANEIAGALDIANQIASKLQALAMAGAMVDPCKLAVLMNVGSDDLKNAAGLINAPLETATLGPQIPTETDLRADPEQVTRQYTEAKERAKTEPGVPQTPFSNLGQLYQPLNAYLFDLMDSVKGIFGDTLYEQSPATDGGSLITTLPVTGSNSQTSEEQIITSENKVSTPKSSSSVTAKREQSDAESLDAFGGEGEVIQPTPNTQSVASNSTVKPSGSQKYTITAQARVTWYKEIGSDFMRIKRKARRESNSIQKLLNSNNTTWESESQKSQAKIYKQAFDSIFDTASNELSRGKSVYKYETTNLDKDMTKEKEKMNEYKNVHGPQSRRSLAKLNRDYVDTDIGWQSLKNNVFRNN